MGSWLPFAVGGGVAVVIAAIELYNRLRSRPTMRGGAPAWWAGRLALEFAVGALAIATLLAAGGVQATNPVSWFIAGAVGPAVARSRFVTFRQGSTEQSYGVSTIYEPVRNFFEGRIDDIGAVEQDQWITNQILPKLKTRGFNPHQLLGRLEIYVNALMRLTDTEKYELIDTMRASLADETTSPDEKMRYLVIYASASPLNGFRMIGRLAESG